MRRHLEHGALVPSLPDIAAPNIKKAVNAYHRFAAEKYEEAKKVRGDKRRSEFSIIEQMGALNSRFMELDARVRGELEGARTAARLLAAECDVSKRDASGEVRLLAILDDLRAAKERGALVEDFVLQGERARDKAERLSPEHIEFLTAIAYAPLTRANLASENQRHRARDLVRQANNPEKFDELQSYEAAIPAFEATLNGVREQMERVFRASAQEFKNIEGEIQRARDFGEYWAQRTIPMPPSDSVSYDQQDAIDAAGELRTVEEKTGFIAEHGLEAFMNRGAARAASQAVAKREAAEADAKAVTQFLADNGVGVEER